MIQIQVLGAVDGTLFASMEWGLGAMPRVGEQIRVNDVEDLDNIPATLCITEIIWQVSALDSDAITVDIYVTTGEPEEED